MKKYEIYKYIKGSQKDTEVIFRTDNLMEAHKVSKNSVLHDGKHYILVMDKIRDDYLPAFSNAQDQLTSPDEVIEALKQLKEENFSETQMIEFVEEPYSPGFHNITAFLTGIGLSCAGLLAVKTLLKADMIKYEW